MVNIETLVYAVLFLLGAGLILGLLFYLINYIATQFPDSNPLFFKAARILLVVFAVLILIGLILDLMGHPIIAWRTRP
jgi:drug/metabolite transporter (DMT)-like permease